MGIRLGMLLSMALLVIGGCAATAWRSRRREQELTRQLLERNEELQAARTGLARLDSVDRLTDLPTHQYFLEFLEREWRRALRDLTPISLLLIDVDHFKAYNERLGQQAGDTCLKRIAAVLRATAGRPGDLVARWGGEQFILALSRTDAEGAAALADRLRGALQAIALPHPASPIASHVTASVGLATAVPNRSATWQEIELVAASERALADAKHQGRNCVARAEFIQG